MATNTIQVHKKGNLTLPVDFRNRYGVDEGDVFTVIDMGDGSFLLTPCISHVNQLGVRITAILDKADITPEELLASLDQEREQYYLQHYVEK